MLAQGRILRRQREPGVLALEITEDLEAALEQFATIAEDLKAPTP